MPIYNVSRYLDKALECAKRQTLHDIEIVCVNDGSTDNSLDIIKRWAEGDDRFVIIDKINEGYGVAMNTGIEKASGEYIAIFEPDDLVPLNMYEDLYEAAKASDLDIVKADFYRFTENESGNRALRYVNIDLSGKLYGQVLDPSERTELLSMVTYTWTGIYRKAFLESNGIKHSETPGASYQDIGFFWKTTACARRVMLINKPYYMYRADNPNQSVKKRDKVYFRDQEYDRIMEFLKANEDPGMWERYKERYFTGRFRRNLITVRRIDDSFTGEYLDYLRSYYTAAAETEGFDPSTFTPYNRKAFDMLMEDPERFLKKYHFRRAEEESEGNTDIWEVLKAEKKKNKELAEENRRLREDIRKIRSSKAYRLARAAGNVMHPFGKNKTAKKDK